MLSKFLKSFTNSVVNHKKYKVAQEFIKIKKFYNEISSLDVDDENAKLIKDNQKDILRNNMMDLSKIYELQIPILNYENDSLMNIVGNKTRIYILDDKDISQLSSIQDSAILDIISYDKLYTEFYDEYFECKTYLKYFSNIRKTDLFRNEINFRDLKKSRASASKIKLKVLENIENKVIDKIIIKTLKALTNIGSTQNEVNIELFKNFILYDLEPAANVDILNTLEDIQERYDFIFSYFSVNPLSISIRLDFNKSILNSAKDIVILDCPKKYNTFKLLQSIETVNYDFVNYDS